jgi:hypothetical protein
MGNTGYLLSALEDSTSAEQFVHDGRFRSGGQGAAYPGLL